MEVAAIFFPLLHDRSKLANAFASEIPQFKIQSISLNCKQFQLTHIGYSVEFFKSDP